MRRLVWLSVGALIGAVLIAPPQWIRAQGYTPPLSIELREEGSSVGRALAIDCVGSTITCTFSATVGTITITGGGGGIDGTLTATRVPFASDADTLTDDADMTFATDTLTATKVIGPTSLCAVGALDVAGSICITSNTITAEGATANTSETKLAFSDATGDNIFTFGGDGVTHTLTTSGGSLWINTSGGTAMNICALGTCFGSHTQVEIQSDSYFGWGVIGSQTVVTGWTQEAENVIQMDRDDTTADSNELKCADSQGSGTAGATCTFSAGDGTSGNANGGNLLLRGGAKAGTGSAGAVALSNGADVASATTITTSGNVFKVTGTTTITSVTARPDGTIITIIFTGVLTFTDGSNLILAGNFVTTADDTITLACDGTNWYEIARSIN